MNEVIKWLPKLLKSDQRFQRHLTQNVFQMQRHSYKYAIMAATRTHVHCANLS
jgi:hypothetical protein